MRDKFPWPQPLHRTALLWSNRNEVTDRTSGGSPGWKSSISRKYADRPQGTSLGVHRRHWIENGAPMQAMLTPKPSDDPHDIVVVAPDVVRVAPADEEIESLLKDKVRVPSEPQLFAAPDSTAGATVPPVDTTFRATAGSDVRVTAGRRS